MKDKISNDGDSIKFEERKCIFLTCCECGLTHLLMLGRNEVTGEFMLYVYRDDDLTEESRKEVKAEKAKKEKKKVKDIIKKNKEALAHADEAIKHAKEEKDDKKADWKYCIVCSENKVAPWNKKKICSPCQQAGKKKPK